MISRRYNIVKNTKRNVKNVTGFRMKDWERETINKLMQRGEVLSDSEAVHKGLALLAIKYGLPHFQETTP
jgi:hypothetical protein